MRGNQIKKQYLSDMSDLPFFLTLEMVASLTGFSYESVKKYVREGKIPGVKIGREWRVKQDDLKNL